MKLFNARLFALEPKNWKNYLMMHRSCSAFLFIADNLLLYLYIGMYVLEILVARHIWLVANLFDAFIWSVFEHCENETFCAF